MTPNPKARNGCQGMLHKFRTKTPSAWLIYPHNDNAHQAQFPDNEALKRPSQYSLGDFWEEIVRQLCGLPDYGSPPENTMVKSPPSTPEEFTTVHIPVFSDTETLCGML